MRVEGGPGGFFFDGVRRGESGRSYVLPPGAHRCGIGSDVEVIGSACDIVAGAVITLPPLPATVTIDRPASLRGADGQAFAIPGRVPGGSYVVWTDFGAGQQVAGQVTVPASGAIEIRCDPTFQSCRVP